MLARGEGRREIRGEGGLRHEMKTGRSRAGVEEGRQAGTEALLVGAGRAPAEGLEEAGEGD